MLLLGTMGFLLNGEVQRPHALLDSLGLGVNAASLGLQELGVIVPTHEIHTQSTVSTLCEQRASKGKTRRHDTYEVGFDGSCDGTTGGGGGRAAGGHCW